MTTGVEQKAAASGLTPEEDSNSHLEEGEYPQFGLCPNPRCKKGPDGTPGIVQSRRAKYCCRYCRVDVCRRNRPKPEQIEKPKRKRRKDAKHTSPAERQRAYEARHSTRGLPQAIKDYLWMRNRRAQNGG